MSKMVIAFKTDGSIEHLLKDRVFDTRFLGDRKIERVSEVTPNEDGHLFFVRWLQGPMSGTRVGPFETYDDAVDYEVASVNLQRREGESFTLANSPMPWCDRCNCYHHHTANHIGERV